MNRQSSAEKHLKATESCLAILRDQGGRITPLVRATVALFLESRSVYTPQQLRDILSEQLRSDIGFPTVYRLIDRMVQAGLLRQMHRADNQTAYYICTQPDQDHHHHFICNRCSTVQEVDFCAGDRFAAFVNRHLQATVTDHIVQLTGLCAACKEKS